MKVIDKFDPVDVIAIIAMIGSFVCSVMLSKEDREPFVKVLEAIVFFYIVKKGADLKRNGDR